MITDSTGGITAITDAPLELGEGVRWIDGALTLVDILAGDLYSLDPSGAGGLQRRAHLDVPLGAVAPIAGEPGRWIVAAGDGVALLDTDGALEWLGRPEERHGGRTRMNDGGCDPQGRFWAGSMAYDGASPIGALYRVDVDRSVHQVLDDLIIANGPSFTADGSMMFLSDSGRAEIRRYRVVDDGTLSDCVVIAHGESGAAPDGMVVDAAGTLWVAMWGGSQIRRYSPDGELLARVMLPASQPSCVTIVPDGAFVTTATQHLTTPTEHDGLVYSVDLSEIEGGPVAPLPTRSFGGGVTPS